MPPEDGAVPLAIRQYMRTALRPQPVDITLRPRPQPVDELPSDDSDDSDPDDAAPPPIARSRPASADGPAAPGRHRLRRVKKSSGIEQIRRTAGGLANFSHPFRYQTRSQVRNAKPPSAHARPRSFAIRHSANISSGLRRWSSLETIKSVATAASLHEQDREPSVAASLRSFSLSDDEESTTDRSCTPSAREEGTTDRSFTLSAPRESTTDRPITPSAPSLTCSSDSSPVPRSSSTSSPSARTTNHSPASPSSQSNDPQRTRPASPVHALRQSASSPSSLLRRLQRSGVREPLLLPEYLDNSSKTALNPPRSRRSSSSNSIMTISSGPPSDMGSGDSRTSTNWKASDFDTSGLSKSEVKKCRKRGINPALYAEMKAARKSKWLSPIVGNTIL